MNERQHQIIKVALIYLFSNVDDANEALEYIHDDAHSCIIVDGEIMPEITEEEISEILKGL